MSEPRPLLLWFGPVAEFQIRASVPSNATLGVLGCLGNHPDGKPSCGDLADRWLDAEGRRLPAARRAVHVGDGPAFVAAFSAGGQIAKRLCAHAADRRELAGLYTGDATYTTSWAEKGRAGLDPITGGYLLFALDALKDGRWWVATASANPNAQYPSGQQTLAALRHAIEQETGERFKDASTDLLLEGLHPPERADRLGNIVFLDFGAKYSHNDHAVVLPPLLLKRMIARSTVPSTPTSSSSSSSPASTPSSSEPRRPTSSASSSEPTSSASSSEPTSSTRTSTAPSTSSSSEPTSSTRTWVVAAVLGGLAAAAWWWRRRRG